MSESRIAPRTSEDVQRYFIEFFAEREHRNVPSSSLVPFDDPTVLLTTAGMQQMIPYMVGRQAPTHVRMTSVQKCFRTTDIDEVGNPRNLTFFEMLGNFSIGDYFKAEIIPWAWDFVINWLHFPAERVYITVHPTDQEALELWLSTGVPRERISYLEDNWWGPPGAEGPCGPDSELYFDRGEQFGCGRSECAPGCDCDRYLEFWNLVFMQFYQDRAGNRTPLAQTNIDTGMGLERVTAIIQDVASVYDTDAFLPVLNAVARLAGTQFGASHETDYALRVVADHARGMTFLICDGVLPGAEGRGYVLRRVIRRAVRYGRRLGIDGPFLTEIAAVVIEGMKGRYPELEHKRRLILESIVQEETRFSETLQAGSARLERWVDDARGRGESRVAGDLLFQLYDSFGFPYELSAEILAESGLEPDLDGYEAALTEQRERSRARAAFAVQTVSTVSGELAVPRTEFVGFQNLRTESEILALRGESGLVAELTPGQQGTVVVAVSPFYPEGGGQVGDRGLLRTDAGVFQVEDTQRDDAGHILHLGRVVDGRLAVGMSSSGEVDSLYRGGSAAHHTVTHILHRALKDVVGEQTEQRGSLVNPDVCRFDFNYPNPLADEQLARVVEIINDHILENDEVRWEVMSIDEARAAGATMIFGEKYGEEVRLVRVGEYSRELCGGTHVRRAGDLGLGLIAREFGIGSGLRRVEVYAGRAARVYVQQQLARLESVAARVGAQSTDQVVERVDAALAQMEQLQREAARLERQLAGSQMDDLVARATTIDGVRVVLARVEAANRDTARELIDRLRDRLGTGVVGLAGIHEDRPFFIVGVTRDLLERGVRADVIAREMSIVAGGKGGGRPDMAQGGGRDAELIGPALDRAAAVTRDLLKSGSDGNA
ncbi:MAG: alanine--tRNA ligase [Chloroflexota bacterium]